MVKLLKTTVILITRHSRATGGRKRKLTQAEMADALNLSQRAYSKIENNEVQIKINRLEEIAKLLSIDSKELLPDLPSQNFENVQYSQIGNGKFINNANENE